jgi:hypothetical protein
MTGTVRGDRQDPAQQSEGTPKMPKPLGGKAYGSIPHLPMSRMGPADHACHEGQARIATEKARDRHDLIIVQEKLDGSCCSVARIGDQIVPLSRAGYLAKTSPYEQHHIFGEWVERERSRFLDLLHDGERVVGEWLAQAHGTRYKLHHGPFVAFDIMRGKQRALVEEADERIVGVDLPRPWKLHVGGPFSIDDTLHQLGSWGYHGALDGVEGAVWRVERKGVVDFLVKYVRPDKVDGHYLPEMSGRPPVWNWTPSWERASA